ncbi:methionine ABC transporter permease [Actinoplanes sp. RD1]|uniref:methionine ABC transporter permease n=1 Tax=Actinoplanes sp. RD1 TaxID=3064538 RepID=UPI002740DDB7|nr:methionine ABC transporter permease [Actinoplanes sp. RD1]
MTAEELTELLWEGLKETLWMVGVATLVTVVGGLLIGVLLVLTDRGGLLPARPVNALLGLVVNVGRSLPFIILLVAVIPFTRALVGTTIGTTAAIVPLAIGAIPFYARLVETALREVPADVVAAAVAMGSSRAQIVGKVLLREARSGLVAGLTVTVIALVGYSAMAGVVGGGGLGDLAIRYGYQRFETEVMIATVVVLVVLVQLVQMLGDILVRRLSHR